MMPGRLAGAIVHSGTLAGWSPEVGKLTLGGGVNRMGRLPRGAQTNDFGAAVLRAHSAGK